VSLRLAVGIERAGVEPAAKRVARSRLHLERPVGRAGDANGGAVDEDAPAGRLDRVAQAVEERLPAVLGVAEELLAGLLAADLAARSELAPEPRHRDLI